MPHDRILIEDTKAWLLKAWQDLRAARVGLEAKPSLKEDALFHCQQAIEKSFKAFLTFHDRPFRKTHNLEELGEECLRIDNSLSSLVDQAVPLSEYAWAFRYPGEPVLPEMAEVIEASRIASETYQAILDRIPFEAHPTNSD
jgi:HEPN domain-containing protein